MVSMERWCPYLYTGSKFRVIWPSVLLIQRGVATAPLRKICSRKTLRRTRVKQGHRRLWHGGGLIWFMVFQRQMHTCSHKGCLRGLCPVRIWKIWYYLKQESCNLVNSFRRKLSAAMSKNNGYFFPWLNVLFC